MFWEQLGLIGQIYFVLGCIASVLLLIQFILLLIGFAGDGDIDIGGDGGADFDGDADGGIGIFTLKGIIGFFAIGGRCCLRIRWIERWLDHFGVNHMWFCGICGYRIGI